MDIYNISRDVLFYPVVLAVNNALSKACLDIHVNSPVILEVPVR